MSNQKEEDGAEGNTEASDKDKPKIYGDYEILKAIGKGKFAVVYRAQRITDGKIVALKRISVDMIDDKARDKCLKEVGLLQSLDHPNIIKYMDSFINENNLVIIVEWAAAGDLKRQLRKAQERQTGFDERIIWKYFSQIADAIQHMHERRIMHRDLKPANIFLTLDGTVKVGDLGLSRELSENTYQAHSKVGTPLYMSPEVLRGDGYDFKSDIWSIGCLLYELAMLKSPFKSEGLNLYSLFQKISQGEYSPLPDRYSDELRQLTYAMISTNPEDRPEIADICREARAMRVKYNEEYLKRKQSQQHQDEKDDDDKSHDADRVESARDRRVSDAKENKIEYSPNSTGVSKVTTVTEPVDAQITSGRKKSIENRRGGRRGDRESDDEDEGSKWGGSETSRSRNTAATKKGGGRRGAGSDDEDSAGTEDTRSNTKPSKLTPPKQYGAGGDEREAGRGHGGRSDRNSSRQENPVVSNKPPPSLRPNKSPGDSDNFIPYIKPGTQDSLPSQQAQQSASLKTPQQQVVQKRRKEAASQNGRATVTTSSSNTASNGNGAHAPRKTSVGGGTELNFDEDDMGDVADSFNEIDKKGASKLASSGAAFAMMDIVYGKLVALGYPLYTDSGRCKITPVHFASDISSLFGRAKTSFPSTQFGSFVEVCLWLVGKANGTGSYGGHIDIDADPPATIVRQLLRFAQDCGVAANMLGEITPTSLLQGNGEKACLLMNLLCDTATEKSAHLWKPFVYPDDSPVVAGPDQTEDFDDDVMEEYTGDGGQDHGDDAFGHDMSGTAAVNLHMSMIVPTVDSSRWKEETERVGPALKAAMVRSHKKSSSWITHVAMLQEYGGKVLSTPANSSDADISAAALVEMLVAVQHNVLQGMSGIARGEKMINTNPDLCNLGFAFAKIKQEMILLEERSSGVSKNAVATADKLAVIEDSLNELTEQLTAKTGEGEGDGSSVAVKFKRAIKGVKEEIKDMTIRLGLLQAELLALKKQDYATKRKSAVAKKKAKHRRKNKLEQGDDNST